MKIKNIRFNKKKVISVTLAFFYSLSTKGGYGELYSHNQMVKLIDGRDAILYFTTGNNEEDYGYVSFDNQVGFVKNKHIIIDNIIYNDYYKEMNKTVLVPNETLLYNKPIDNNDYIIDTLPKGTKVRIIAQNDNDWYIITTNDKRTGFIPFNSLIEHTCYAKITGNNVNIRSAPSTSSSKLGFADITDQFEIIDKTDNWYKINYLDNLAYVHKNYVKEVTHEKQDIIKSVYLNKDESFLDENKNIITILPKYQLLHVIEENNDYYHVLVDGIEGYILKNSTKSLTDTFTLIDLPRQIVKIYNKNKEIYRCRIITGSKSLQTNIGCFKIGHLLTDYQLTVEHRVSYWMQFDNNIGLHDADWQEPEYFILVTEKAYENYAKGKSYTYPFKYGSHGCGNLTYQDAYIIYHLLHINDNVLVIGPNDLIYVIKNTFSKVKKLIL